MDRLDPNARNVIKLSAYWLLLLPTVSATE